MLRGLELMGMLREDLDKLAARSRHELLRCHELIHRAWVAEAHLRPYAAPQGNPLARLLLPQRLP